MLAVVLAACGAAHAQWDLEDSHSTADLRGIDNVGGGVAWASGTNGTVLRTEDGGYLWKACSIPPGAEHLDFRGVQAFDANTANWRALHPALALHEAPAADREWNALSLPFVVGPHGRIGKLNPKALAH